jgi:site-specific DNA recombinase
MRQGYTMMDAVLTTEYDGCGMCLVGVVRLSRKTDPNSSPEPQRGQIFTAVAEVGGHIIA